MKANPLLPDDDGPMTVIYLNRDPTEKDTNYGPTLWISKEYVPNRVFKGQRGEWIFIGKFYPNET